MNLIRIERHMVKSPFLVEASATLREAADLLSENGIRHLPVIEEESLVGLISERDLREGIAAGGAKLKVSDVMKSDVYAVLGSTPLHEVVQEMAESKIGSAVVLSKDREVVGIFTSTDALELLATMLQDDKSDLLLEEEVDFWIPEGESTRAFARRQSLSGD